MATTSGTASWGVTAAAPSGVTGVLTHFESDAEGILAPQYNELGQVIQQVHYDRHATMSCTVEVAADVEPPKTGSVVTVNGTQYYVTRARIVEDNRSYRHIEISGETYANCNAVTEKVNAG